MRFAIVATIIGVACSGAMAFDFSLVDGEDWGNLSQGSGAPNVPDFEVGVSDFNSWHFQDDNPPMYYTATDGPDGAADIWVKHDRWSGIKLVQLANMPPVGTVVQLSYSYIQEDAFPDRGVYLNGFDTGLIMSLSGGNEDGLTDGTYGTNYAFHERDDLAQTGDWTDQSIQGMITTSHDYLAVVLMQAGGNAGSDRGFDNVVLSVARLAGDGNNDGAVTDADYTIWADNFGASGATVDTGDYNGDGEVTDADYTIWADNFGAELATTPEPATLSVLTAAGLLLLRRKR
jgi:hypothetical protein